MPGTGRPASLGPDEIQRPGGGRLGPAVLERATRTVGRGSIELYEGQSRARGRRGGGSKESIVTRDGFGENKDGRRGWWAGRRSGKVEKARRDGETGGRRWEIDACLLRPRPRSRSGAGAARKAEFRARSWGWFGEGRWTADNKKSPVNFHAWSKMLAAGCPPIDAASPLNILRKLGVLARK